MPAILRQFMDCGGSHNEKDMEIKNEKNLLNQSNYQFENVHQNFEGLSNKEAEKFLKKNGKNCLVSHKNVSAVKIFAGQFKDFLVLILLIATAISIFMGEITEAVVIFSILFLNALMGFLQEFKTEKTLQALDDMISPNAKVMRDGKLTNISADLLVPRDIVFLECGDSVPADCLVLKCNHFEVDESMLTGESVAVEKQANLKFDDVGDDFNKNSMVFMGTSVIKGTAKVQVLKTGMSTQMGKISEMIGDVQKEQTPIQRRLAQMGAIIVFGCLFAAILVIFIGVARGEHPFEMVVTGLSMAVASVPEGLPAIVTIALAFAVKHMVKKKALVRKLHAVETLGCANLICTDKTGTITQNRMTVKKIITAVDEFDFGEGFSIKGNVLKNNDKFNIDDEEVLNKIMKVFVLCNSAEIIFNRQTQDLKSAIGEPTEIALLIAAAKLNIHKKLVLNNDFEIYDEIPFDSTKKYMAVFAKLKKNTNKKFVFVKGAYDVVSQLCSKCLVNEDEISNFEVFKSKFDESNNYLANDGLRVLAFAYGELEGSQVNFNGKLIFLGLSSMFDPPRPEAKRAVLTCRNAGIRTVMITGDHKLTAVAIAKKVGIYNKNYGCVEGKELDFLNDDELKQLVKKTAVFARVTPAHKLRIVKAFKRCGHVVAMTGDGVNDAPAIKEASIGVAMGKNGSDVAKQAADLVLLDDNFATLVCAVEEGRIIYSNMRKFIRYLLSCNFGEVLTSLFAMFAGMPVPLLPMQILLINLVTDGLPAIALSLEPSENQTMAEPPRSIKETIFSNGLISKILVRGILIALSTLTVFTLIFRMTLSIELARTATFLALIGLQLVHVFECKSEKKSIFRINYLNNRKLIFAVGLSSALAVTSVWFEPISRVLKNYPLSLDHILIVLLLVFIVPFFSGVWKEIQNFFKKRRERSIFPEIYGKF